MNALQTVLIAGLTTMAMATFSSIANFIVNRYAPRICDWVEKRLKKHIDNVS